MPDTDFRLPGNLNATKRITVLKDCLKFRDKIIFCPPDADGVFGVAAIRRLKIQAATFNSSSRYLTGTLFSGFPPCKMIVGQDNAVFVKKSKFYALDISKFLNIFYFRITECHFKI
jgi:hypothetical protein